MLSMGCLGIMLEVSFRTVPNVVMKFVAHRRSGMADC